MIMDINSLKKLNIGEIKEYVDLKKYTTYKAGGLGRFLVIPDNRDSLIKLLNYIKKNNLKYKILGFGSNLIFSDSLYDGILIKLDNLNDVKINGTEIYAEAGYSLIKLSLLAARNSLAGLEFASGIPGSVGGAIFMNAGAYKSDMGYIVKEVEVLTPDLEIKIMKNKELDFRYRTSFLQNNKGYIFHCPIRNLREYNEHKIYFEVYNSSIDAIQQCVIEKNRRWGAFSPSIEGLQMYWKREVKRIFKRYKNAHNNE